MCDVLDLSVRCPSSQLPPLDVNAVIWTTSSNVSMTHVDAATAWSISADHHVDKHYELEPISPCSSADSPPSHAPQPRSFLDRSELDGMCQRRTTTYNCDQALQDRRHPATGHWSSDVSLTQLPSSGAARRWNGDEGHPYSPLKRVLHQYRNGLSQDIEVTVPVTINSRSQSPEQQVSQPVSTPATTSAGVGSRKPTMTTTATSSGMSFEEFVLGMLSKVGGGKAITAATQSYLRESAATTSAPATSNNCNNSTTDTQAPSVIVGHKTSRFDEPMVPSPGVYQAPEHRRQLGLLESTMHDFIASPYQQPASRPPSDICLMPPHQPLLPMLRRPPVRPESGDRDQAYRERRRKNNEAAKRSRDTRRLKELQVASQAERLAEENLQLKAEIAVLRSQLGYLHRMMLDNNNGPHLNNSNVNGSDTEAGRPESHHDNASHLYQPEENGRRV